MPYYLPVLLNPLINAVFNCPTPGTSSLKKVFVKLKNRRFILVVPRTNILLEYEDLETGSTLQELSYTYDFVASHIIFPEIEEGLSENEFRTLSGKTVLIRPQNGAIFTADGFDRRRRFHITDFELFPNFNDYLTGAIHFPLLFVDLPLVGNVVKREDWESFAVKQIDNVTAPGSTKDQLSRERTTFEQVLRIHPTLGNSFNDLFKNQRSIITSSSKDLQTLGRLFEKFCVDACELLSSESQFDHFTNKFKLVHEYVEVNLYDDFWSRLTMLNQGKEIESICDYQILKYISISQVSTFLYPHDRQKFDLHYVTSAEKNIEAATGCFKKLATSSTHSEKSEIIIETLQTLTKTIHGGKGDIAIDADTLMSMMILVVCRSQLKNLKSHLAYLQKFSENQTAVTFGILAYGLSTLEAVLYYFDDQSKLKSLEKHCLENKVFWEKISLKSSDLNNLTHSTTYMNLLGIRTADGRSSLSICIQRNNIDMFRNLLLKCESEFPLEDLLNDETTDRNTLLMELLQVGEEQVAEIFVEILLSSCTNHEVLSYLNRTNKVGRSAAHYLMHAHKLLYKVGHLFNWDLKDINGHTPLFAIFRSYDQTDYDKMVSWAYWAATQWYESRGSHLQLRKHMDSKGNTLLHIIKSNLDILLINDSINVNAVNRKGLTPLMMYARYNRLRNIQSLVKDKRLIIDKLQKPLFLTCFDYVKNPIVLEELGREMCDASSFTTVSAHSIKFECDDWFLWMTAKSPTHDPRHKTLKHSLKALQSFLMLFLKTNPMTFLPVELIINELKSLSKFRIMNISRLETNHFLHNITFFLSTINEDPQFKDVIALPEPEFLEWIKRGLKKEGGQLNERIEPEEIHSVQSFLRFNLSELNTIKTSVVILGKLAAFRSLKSADVNESYRMLLKKGTSCYSRDISESFRVPQNLKFVVESYPFESLARHLQFFEQCTTNLIEKIHSIVEIKIPKWWQLYGELIDLRNEYKKNFPHSVKPHANNGGIFGSYIETKRFKLEETLTAKTKACVKRLALINNSIKEDNEMIAVEVSKYLSFKARFWKSGIINDFSARTIKVINEQLECMKEAVSFYHDQTRQ